ncbi:hypothetical protein [Dapis sp. BLCC M172]|uniref:hypothetical protein n=1 Tax=Dapis sp. BLCC M172 TaxID=2975281 RepID=UPI003CECD0B8
MQRPYKVWVVAMWFINLKSAVNNIFQQHLQKIAPTRSLLDWNQKKLQNFYLHA